MKGLRAILYFFLQLRVRRGIPKCPLEPNDNQSYRNGYGNLYYPWRVQRVVGCSLKQTHKLIDKEQSKAAEEKEHNERGTYRGSPSDVQANKKNTYSRCQMRK
jgi:hypothetical protein